MGFVCENFKGAEAPGSEEGCLYQCKWNEAKESLICKAASQRSSHHPSHRRQSRNRDCREGLDEDAMPLGCPISARLAAHWLGHLPSNRSQPWALWKLSLSTPLLEIFEDQDNHAKFQQVTTEGVLYSQGSRGCLFLWTFSLLALGFSVDVTGSSSGKDSSATTPVF